MEENSIPYVVWLSKCGNRGLWVCVKEVGCERQDVRHDWCIYW